MIKFCGLLIGAAALVAGLNPSAAHASTVYAHVGEFGGTGSGDGLFGAAPPPGRVAVHEASGKVFAVDTENHRVQVFDPVSDEADPDFPAEFDFQIPAPGDTATINEPIGVAIDQDTGDVYVAAAGTTNAIVKFNPDDPANPTAYTVDGDFTSPPHGGFGVGSFGEPGPFGTTHRGGIAVDPTTGDILLADTGNDWLWRFDSDGNDEDLLFDFGFDDLFDVAVDSQGDVLVADFESGEGSRIERFDTDFDHVRTLPLPDTDSDFWGATVSVNPNTDEVLAGFKPADSGPARVAHFEDDDLVGLIAPTLDGLENRFNSTILGLALRGQEPGRLYAMATHQLINPIPRMQVFAAGLPPTVAIDPVAPASVTGTEATFTGTVNPEGQEATWRFEYGLEGTGPGTWQQIDDGVGEISAGTIDVDVAAEVGGLEPNTEYEVRLCAETSVEACSPVEAFATDAVPPAVSATAIPGATMASLRGEVNPRNSATSWRLEYRAAGATEWIAAGSGDAGDGGTTVHVHARADGLEPTSTYEFRLLATNQAGTEATDVESFVTAAAPPERAYELVSPLPTRGVDIQSGADFIIGRGAAEDGERALFTTVFSPLPGIADERLTQRYLAERNSDGWVTHFGVDDVDLGPAAFRGGVRAIASEGVCPILLDPARPDAIDIDPDDRNEVADVYLRGCDGEFTWVSRDPRIPPGTAQTDPGAVQAAGQGPSTDSMSADGRTVVLRSFRQLLDADPHGPGDGRRLYKWSDGQLELIGVLPGAEAPDPGEAYDPADVPTGAVLGQTVERNLNAVSRDGSRVFWRAGSTLYAHVEGAAETIEVGSGTYAGAAADGSRAFFTSAGDLFAFDVDAALAGDPDPLLRLTTDAELVAPGNASGVATVADSGTHAYFVADAVIAEAEAGPGGTEPSPEGRNLYLAEFGSGGDVRIRFVAGPLDASSGEGRALGFHVESFWTFREAHVSPDGSVLAFSSVAELLAGQPTGGHRQIYVYDDEAATLVCASCPPDGSEPAEASPPWRFGSGGVGAISNGRAKPRYVADDGTVFFDTPTRLLPGVSNRAHDVYAYRRGELTLISTGTGSAPSFFWDASADGSTAFFLTRDALVPRDDEPGIRKLYAARVGGGFPPPPASPAPCVGDGCQDPAPEAPGHRPPPSSGVEAPGNPPEARISADRLSRKQARRLARGKRIAVGAEVSGPGRVAVVARTRLRRGGNMVRVGRAVTRAPRAGEVLVRGLRMNRRAMRALRRQGRIVVRIVARHRGEASGQRVRLGNPNRLQRRAKRLRQRATRQARRGHRARAQTLRQRAQRLDRQSRRLNRPINATAGRERGQG